MNKVRVNKSTRSVPLVAIIGAGPAGLSAARNLKLRGIEYEQFERHTGVGGIWDINNPGTPMYESAHFISSRDRSGYFGFPMPAHYPDYPRRDQILEYTRHFAERFDLAPNIRFSTAVDALACADHGWQITLDTGERRSFSHVICASGHTWTPNWPSYPGEFSGKVMHAVDYRSGEQFAGQRVLVVGAGNSACDIACDAAQFADASLISMRRGYHFIPKHLFGIPADQFANRSRWLPFGVRRRAFEWLLGLLQGDLSAHGLQAPDHSLLASHPIINSQLIHYLQHGDITICRDIDFFDGDDVVFTDGARHTVDLVVYATGYRYEIPYAPSALFEWNGYKPSLDYSVFNRRHESLFAVGFSEMNGGGYYLFDMMTSLIADAIVSQTQTPEHWRVAKTLISTPPNTGPTLNMVDSDRHKDYLDVDRYLAACQRLIKRLGWRDPERMLRDSNHPTDPEPAWL
ncbi:MAG: NAD(P)-binding domain-containing protein [Pseudomonadota bacterium]